jgi:predicted GNAT family N-acyltransferase
MISCFVSDYKILSRRALFLRRNEVLLMIRGKFLLSGDPLCKEVYDIRRRVFVEECGYPEEAAYDAFDRMAVYALILDDDGTPSATGRLYIDEEDRFTIGRVCVLKECRKRYMGDLVMRMLLYRAQELNCAAVAVSAKLDAVPFYSRYGLSPVGEVYEADGTAHRRMVALKDEINLEGSCSKGGACGSCHGNCDACAAKA